MKKKYLFLFAILFSIFIMSQNSSFIYELNYKPNADSLKTEKIIYYLDIKNNESIFRSDAFRYSDSIRIKRGFGEGFDIAFNNKQLYIYKNYISNSVKKYVFVPLVFSIFSIEIQPNLQWNITGEKIKIGKYNCQKAEAKYGGRNWIAWFTDEIPIQDGPYIFHGLPGLIVNLSDNKSDYAFSLGEIRNFLWEQLYPEKSQKTISWNEFEKIQKSFYTDPFSMINKSDVKRYDDAGNLIQNDFAKENRLMQQRIRERNNPIELDRKIEYK